MKFYSVITGLPLLLLSFWNPSPPKFSEHDYEFVSAEVNHDGDTHNIIEAWKCRFHGEVKIKRRTDGYVYWNWQSWHQHTNSSHIWRRSYVCSRGDSYYRETDKVQPHDYSQHNPNHCHLCGHWK